MSAGGASGKVDNVLCLPCSEEGDDLALLRANELIDRAVVLGSKPLDQLCSCVTHRGRGVVLSSGSRLQNHAAKFIASAQSP